MRLDKIKERREINREEIVRERDDANVNDAQSASRKCAKEDMPVLIIYARRKG